MRKWGCLFILLLIGMFITDYVQATPLDEQQVSQAHLFQKLSNKEHVWEQPQSSTGNIATRLQSIARNGHSVNKPISGDGVNSSSIVQPYRFLLHASKKTSLLVIPSGIHLQLIYPFHYFW